MEAYMDDILSKSKKEKDNVQVSRKLFERLWKFLLKLNPVKFSFEVKTRKLSCFIMSSQGIKFDPNKVKAIQDMSVSKTKKEVRSFLGHLNYIARFIS